MNRPPYNRAQSFEPDPRASSPTALANYEAEQALLAAILANNLVYPKVSDFLRPAHFADALHGRIFEAMGRQIEAGELCNVLTLKAAFENDPALVDVGGGGKYLARLAGSVVTIIGAEDYGRAIHDLWMRRELVARAEELQAAASNMDRPADEAAAVAIRDLTEMAGEVTRAALDKETVASSLVDRIMKPGACYSTGIESLDEAMGGGLYAGKLYGFAARKKVGKTVLLGTISHNLHKAKVPHLFIALEMSPAEIEQRNAARELGINSIAFLRSPTKALASRVADYAVGLGRHAVYESAPGASLDQVRGMISRAIVRHKIRGVVLDYWQLVGGKAPRESEEYHLRNVAQWLADTCRKHGLWAIVACQVNQEGNTRGGEGLKLACDLYFTLHREKGSDGAWLEMEESRYVPYCNVGDENSPGLWLNHCGPFFDDVSPPADRATAALSADAANG